MKCIISLLPANDTLDVILLITMEIDTGAALSIMSDTEYQYSWTSVPLKSTPIKLHTCTSKLLKVLEIRKYKYRKSAASSSNHCESHC